MMELLQTPDPLASPLKSSAEKTSPCKIAVIRISLIMASILLVNGSFGQDDPVAAQKKLIGTTLAELKITDFLKNKPVTGDFTGKYIVIEFWATWCRPCLNAVPHINKLQRKFSDADSLVFLSMTDESPVKTAKTLERVNFETIVVSDQSRTTHSKLNILYAATMVLPRTVLIDNKGVIVWYGTPHKLTANVIRRFLAGKLLK